MSDLCVHRGTALSLGWVTGRRTGLPLPRLAVRHGRAVHGDPAEGGSGGRPGQGPGAAFRAQERYGLIWVALEEPRWPLPEVPELEDGDWVVVPAGPYRWRCDAARQVENFTDFGHFPWVHPGLLGDPERPVVPSHQVEHRRPRAALPRSSARRRPTARTSPSSATSRPGRRNGAAATNCTCRTRSCCGSAGAASAAWCTSSPRSRSPPTAARATWSSAATTTPTSRTR